MQGLLWHVVMVNSLLLGFHRPHGFDVSYVPLAAHKPDRVPTRFQRFFGFFAVF